MKKIFIVLSLVICACSCSTISMNEVKIGTSNTPNLLTDFYKKAEITTLKDTTSYIGGISSLKKDTRYYYVLDDKKEVLSIFDLNGNQINSIHRLGRSQDEYLGILDFDIKEDSIYLLCSPNKIIVTDSQLTPYSVHKLDGNFTRICIYGEMTYLYDGVQRALYTFDKRMTPKEILKEGMMPACPRLGSPVFFKTKKGLLYTAEGGDVIYIIKGAEAIPFFVLDYPCKQKVMERYAQKEILKGEDRSDYCSPVIKSVVEIGKELIITYSYDMIFRSFVLDYDTRNVVQDGFWKGLTPFPQFYSDGSVLSTAFATPDKCLVDTSSFSISYTSGKIGEDGNLVIIEYK